MPLFDTHIVVDWSARSKPGPVKGAPDSIWWAVARDGVVDEPQTYARTRHDAITGLAELVATERKAGRRVLVGFDFPFGYPKGVARDLTGHANALALWQWLADRIKDDERNHNNRFAIATEINRIYPGEGPCWGRPEKWDYPEVSTHANDREHPPPRRITERHATGAKTVWQLHYSGSVGSQTLLGLPALQQLRNARALRGQVAVWPFEGGLALPDKPIVFAEVYPSLLRDAVKTQMRKGEVVDCAQVRVNARAFATLDAAGGLTPLFGGSPRLESEQREQVEEEGWILGVGFESELHEAAKDMGPSFIGALRDTIIRYDDPFEPAAPVSDWSAHQ